MITSLYASNISQKGSKAWIHPTHEYGKTCQS
jgi:hypothetical protein